MKKDFFYNINSIKNNKKISIISTNNIPENTLITIISGKVEFKKIMMKKNKEKRFS